jgi:uncharacterized protein (DUF1778 family)
MGPSWGRRRYDRPVATLNLRLGDDEMARLRAQAERERRSMNEVVRLAVLDRIEEAERRERVIALTDQVMEEHAYTLERLKNL